MRHFFHNSPVTGTEVVNTNFQAATKHVHDLNAGVVPFLAERNFIGRIDSIQVVLDTLAGSPSPTKCTIRLTEDEAGNITIIPDTEADLALGIGDATVGCAVFKAQTIMRQDLAGPGNGNFYLFVKVDAGTARFLGSELFWSE
jgi:hypothetical protein